MNLERIENRLAGVITQLAKEGKKANVRVQHAVEDCLQEDITDKERIVFYKATRQQCERHGYGEHLPPSGARDVDPALAKAYAHINTTITNFVTDGLANNPDALMMQRPKKNNAGVIMHTQETLINTMVSSAERWYNNALKDKHWNGNVDTMANIEIPNDNPTTTEEVQQ